MGGSNSLSGTYAFGTFVLQVSGITATAPAIKKDMAHMYRTQKARGLDLAWYLSTSTGYGYSVAPVHGVFPHQSQEKWDAIFSRQGKAELFARPCPVVPRHGFVESRTVKTFEEFQNVIKETLEHDKNGEVILMDRLTGKYSAVMTATGVTWGRGNDGVTSGKGEQRLIPAPAGNFDHEFLGVLGEGKGSNQGIYCELVEHEGRVYIVQMRLGPKQPDSRARRVVRGMKTKIDVIVKPHGDDLIAWDELLNKKRFVFASDRILAWLPGQSLSSHFVVQALAAGCNVSVEPECPAKVGDTLHAETSAPNELTPLQYQKLARYLQAETKTLFWDFPRDVLLAVGILHATPYWGGEPWLLKMRARGAISAARYGLAACLGESRHLLRVLRPDNSRTAQVPWKDLLGYTPSKSEGRPSRPYVFVRSLAAPWEQCHSLALNAADDLWIDGLGRVTEWLKEPKNKLFEYKTSYRGHKWEWAALRVHDLICAINKFVAMPNADNWGLVLGQYNEIINASHNGGYLLSKWAEATLIDNVACAPTTVFGFRQAMSLVWNEKFEKRGTSWLPLTMLADKTDYVCIHGIWVHRKVRDALIRDKVINGDYMPYGTNCGCANCVSNLWMPIGMAASSMMLPAYVSVDMLPSMPYYTDGSPVSEEACENGSENCAETEDEPEDNDDGEALPGS